MIPTLRSAVLLCCACLFAMSSGTSTVLNLIVPPAEAAETIGVEALLVRASRGQAQVDPSLRHVARDLAALPYQRFERLGGMKLQLAVGVGKHVDLGNGVTLQINVLSATPQGASLGVTVMRGGKTISQMTINRPYKRAQVLSAGRQGDAALVVPIIATP